MKTIFDPNSLAQIVKDSLADSPDIPDGARGAFLTVANQDGIKAVIAVKVADSWQVGAFVEKGWDREPVEYGVQITGTF